MIAPVMVLAASLLSFRDAATGFAVPADARLAVLATGENVPVTIWVEPQQRPEELRPSVVLAQLRPAQMFFHGHVSDTVSGAPLEGALVTARSSRITARTDARGYFSMHVAAYEEEGLPAGEDLSVTIDGYRTHTILNTALMSGSDTHFIIRLERGTGSTSRDDSHKIWQHRPGGQHPHADELPPNITSTKGGPIVTVPSTIRVGFGCTTGTNCTSVEIFPIDTYVKRGLNDEWIASWPQDSLRAGAVAYRSYGAWHVAHSRTATYDICSTTSCQVNDTDTSVSTDLAVNATTGYVVVLNGEIMRSEYSSELNNLLGALSCTNVDRTCGDGFAGSPAAFWPCLPDPVCTGDT
ncbi:MAG: SpoIID/LytB domain-containing protein [Thermoanaerobaculia bacterium]